MPVCTSSKHRTQTQRTSYSMLSIFSGHINLLCLCLSFNVMFFCSHLVGENAKESEFDTYRTRLLPSKYGTKGFYGTNPYFMEQIHILRNVWQPYSPLTCPQTALPFKCQEEPAFCLHRSRYNCLVEFFTTIMGRKICLS